MCPPAPRLSRLHHRQRQVHDRSGVCLTNGRPMSRRPRRRHQPRSTVRRSGRARVRRQAGRRYSRGGWWRKRTSQTSICEFKPPLHAIEADFHRCNIAVIGILREFQPSNMMPYRHHFGPKTAHFVAQSRHVCADCTQVFENKVFDFFVQWPLPSGCCGCIYCTAVIPLLVRSKPCGKQQRCCQNYFQTADIMNDGHHPTLPSRLIPISFWLSAMNSIGSCWRTSRTKPLTISATASSDDKPRCMQ